MTPAPLSVFPQQAPVTGHPAPVNGAPVARPGGPMFFGGRSWVGPSPATAAYAHVATPARLAASSQASRNA